MIKILFIVPSLAVGGMEKTQVNLANALVEKGFYVTIKATEPNTELLNKLNSKVNYQFVKPGPCIFIKKLPYLRYKFFDFGMWETRASAKKLYKYYVGNEKYDVEIAFFRGLPIKIISGSTNNKSIKLAWVHSDFSKAVGYNSNFRNIKDVRKAYSVFDKVICVSNEAKKGFIKTIGDLGNLTTIYNVVPCKQIVALAEKKGEFEIPKSNCKIVMVGRLLDSVKGQLRLINSVVKLKNEGYDLSLTLVGGGVDAEKIHSAIVENSAQDYICMTGSQTNPYPYIKNSDLLVCASYFEGYNLTVAEALILGVPVLSTNCTGPNEILDHGKYGMIVENSEDGLYSGIKHLLDHPDRLEYYKQKAKERLDFFNEEKIIGQIEELFER